MKWIKHQTSTTGDEKIARLIGQGGQIGQARYGVYWMVNEIIASQMEGKDPSCSVTYPIGIWARKLFTRPSLVESTLLTLAVTGEREGSDNLVTIERVGSEIRVTNRNLLKYRDDYARKSGLGTEKVPLEPEEDTEEKKEKVKREKPGGEFSLFDHQVPEWLPLDAWLGWMEVRLVKKDKNGRLVPWTKRCATIALGKMDRWREEHYDLVKILDSATFGNWQGLYIPEGLKPVKPKIEFRRGDPNSPADWAAATPPDWDKNALLV